MSVLSRKGKYGILAAAFLAVIFCAGAPAAQAATYYVATTGDDAWDGSSGTPWATIQYAVDNTVAGDTIIVQPGTYTGCRIENSGAPGLVKTLKAETAGTVLLNVPSGSAAHNGILEIENYSQTTAYWIIEGLEVDGISSTYRCIDLRDTDHCEIRNNVVHDAYMTGIFCAFSDYVLVENNTSYDNGEHGIYVNNSADNGTVRRNISYNNTANGIHMNGDVSMGGDGIMSNWLVELNTCYDNPATGINCDGVENSTMRNNLLYHNNSKGFSIYGINSAVSSRNDRILNNTVVMPTDGSGYYAITVTDAAGPPTGNKFFNNILYHYSTASNRGSICMATSGETDFESNYNVVMEYFGLDDNAQILTFAEWQARGYDLNSIQATDTALFVDPVGEDFHLKSDSPARDAGTTLADVTDDLEGVTRPQDSAYDIGCYEVSGTPAPLNITTTSLPDGYVNTFYSQTMVATGGVAPYTWSVFSGSLPAGLSLNSSTGEISGTPTTEETANFGIQVLDSQGTPDSDTQALSILINPESAQQEVTLQQGLNGYTGWEDTWITVNAPDTTAGSDIQGDMENPARVLQLHNFDLSGIPAGSTLQQAVIEVYISDVITSTPSVSAFRVIQPWVAAEATYNNASASIPWAAPGLLSGTDYTATDFAQSSTISSPQWATIDITAIAQGWFDSSYANEGIMLKLGPAGHLRSYMSEYAGDPTLRPKLTITYIPAGLTITTTVMPYGVTGVPYSGTLTADFGDLPYTWSIVSGSLPTGLSLNSSTGEVSGTPTVVETANFTAEVTDNSSTTAQKALSIAVYATAPVVDITTTSLPDAEQGAPYSQTLSATGGLSPYTWSVVSGALPAGLSLSASTGEVSGTATTLGTSNFTVEAADSNIPAATDQQALSIDVVNATLDITTATLADALQNSAYTQTLTALGGVPPYSWSIISGSLPAGLSLNASTGEISGSATTIETANFTAQVTDSDSPASTDQQALSIEVIATVPSPTGREPKILWTPARQAVWNQMVAENHPWWQTLQTWADATGGAGERYSDNGQCATMAYQWTGDVNYARAAWDRIQPALASMLPWWQSRNGTRAEFISWVWMYDWLYPALTTSERDYFIDYLNHLGDLCLDRVDGTSWGTRTTDSDETTGHYFGLALLDIATAPDNPRAGTFLNNSVLNGAPVGGLDATEAAMSTLRNSIAYYVQEAEGGPWVESIEYNVGTLGLLLLGTEGVYTATGVEHFPEVRAYIKDVALNEIHKCSSNVFVDQQHFQWGDCEDPRVYDVMGELTLLGHLVGLTQDDPTVGPYIHQFFEELTTSDLNNSDRPWPRFFLLYNPYAAKSDWRTVLPESHFAPGQGILHFRDGWDTQASFLGVHVPGWTYVDHEVSYMGDVQLLREGEWGLTHPIGYGGEVGERMNTMQMAGLQACRESRQHTANEFGAAGEFAYVVGVTGGRTVRENYWNPPETFVDEWTRSILYLPSSDRTSDAVIIYDRVSARDPRDCGSFDGYSASDEAAVQAADGKKQWFVHMPVQPTTTSGTIEWQTGGGQNVRVDTLLPTDGVKEIFDETVIGVPGYHHASEEKWQVRIMPAAQREWDPFLNVVQVFDGGADAGVTLVQSTQGEAQGVHLTGRADGDVLVVFNAAWAGRLNIDQEASGRSVYSGLADGLLAQARMHTAGFTVEWTAQDTVTDVFLMDLDPSSEWFIELDGGGQTPLTVNSQAMARLTPAGTGQHTIEITKGGAAPLNITTLSLPDGQVGVAYSETLAATGGVTPYSWAVTVGSLPAGLSLNSSTGEISGTPTTEETANFTVEVTDSDTPASTDTQALSIDVGPSAPPPLNITTTSLPDGVVATPYSQTLAATGGVTPYSWAVVVGSLPAGLSLNSSTGEISGTPTTTETANFTVEATDSQGTPDTDQQALSITIIAAPDPLVITTTSLPDGQVGVGYSQTLQVTGGVAPYSWAVTVGTLPAGLSLNSGTGEISGTPTTPETANFTVEVTDSQGTPDTDTQALSITIDPAALVITTSSLGDGQEGVAYSETLAATGGVTPYSWAVTVGSLPAGLSLNSSTGEISGTPTTAETAPFTVEVTDSDAPASTDTQALSITINAAGGGVTYEYAASASIESTNSDVWQDKVVLNFTSAEADDWIILGSAEHYGDYFGGHHEVRMQVDGGTEGYVTLNPTIDFIWLPFTAQKLTNLSAGPHTVTIQYRSIDSVELDTYIRNA
ncbi:MAG: putative Ig domain-containing protein, partial [Planctomycetota bacterium]